MGLLSYRVMSKEYCKALVIRCIDFRFVTQQRDFLEKQGYKDKYDLLTVPGASKSLKKIAEAIDLAVKLHNPEEILIFDHEDCGVYQPDNSMENHKKHLRKAKTNLLKKYPELKVQTFITKFKTIEEIA